MAGRIVTPTATSELSRLKGRTLELERRLEVPDGPFPVVYSFVMSGTVGDGTVGEGVSGVVTPLNGCRVSSMVVTSTEPNGATETGAFFLRKNNSTVTPQASYQTGLTSGEYVSVLVFDPVTIGPTDTIGVSVANGVVAENVTITLRGTSTVAPDFQTAGMNHTGGGCICSSIICTVSGTPDDDTSTKATLTEDSNIGTAFSVSSNSIVFDGDDGTEVTVHAGVVFAGDSGGTFRKMRVWRDDGTAIDVLYDVSAPVGTEPVGLGGSRTIVLADEDEISVRVHQDSGGALAILTDLSSGSTTGESVSFVCVAVNCGCSGTANTIVSNA